MAPVTRIFLHVQLTFPYTMMLLPKEYIPASKLQTNIADNSRGQKISASVISYFAFRGDEYFFYRQDTHFITKKSVKRRNLRTLIASLLGDWRTQRKNCGKLASAMRRPSFGRPFSTLNYLLPGTGWCSVNHIPPLIIFGQPSGNVRLTIIHP